VEQRRLGLRLGVRGMGVNHRGGRQGDESPGIWSGDANANCPPRFVHVSKFQAPDCLHYRVVMQ